MKTPATLFIGSVLVGILSACQTQTRTITPQPPPLVETNKSQTVDEAVGSDACSTALRNIQGALLMYYAMNHRMPDSLDELRPLADPDVQLSLACPASKQAYLYTPHGLGAVGKTKRIILSDPYPSHGGNRWCIFMDDPASTAAVKLDVLMIHEKMFQTYQPIAMP